MNATEQPIRIYLDQKDFSRIGKGLAGNPQCAADARAYERLLRLAESGAVRFFFSWCHVFEALRYDKEKVSLLKPYCSAVDSLCQGRCLRWPPEIMEAEVDRFLANEFGLPSPYLDDYPYGRLLDHLPPIPYDAFDTISVEHLRAILRKDVISKLPAHKQKAAERKLYSDRFMKTFLMNLPPETISSLLPGMSLTGEEVVDMVFGDAELRNRILQSKFEALGSFLEMIRLSVVFPPFKKLGTRQVDRFLSIKQLIKLQQGRFDPQDPNWNMDSSRLRQDLVGNFIDYIDGHTSAFCKKHGIKLDDARNRLNQNRLEGVPSLQAAITFQVEYYRHHRGKADRSRTPAQSDLMDLQHIFFLPYVDIYTTDAFFAEVARNAARVFQTHVVKNTTGVVGLLETEFGIH